MNRTDAADEIRRGFAPATIDPTDLSTKPMSPMPMSVNGDPAEPTVATEPTRLGTGRSGGRKKGTWQNTCGQRGVLTMIEGSSRSVERIE